MNAFSDVKDLFIVETKNPWAGTPLASYYSLNPRSKGSAGEKIIERLLLAKGYKVDKPKNSGHDRIINGRKTEIKFGLATDRNYNYETIFNHIGLNKDWEDILFVCVNGDGAIKSALYNKKNLPDILHHQQGGEQSTNDDFMINGKDAHDVLFNVSAMELI